MVPWKRGGERADTARRLGGEGEEERRRMPSLFLSEKINRDRPEVLPFWHIF